MAERLTSRRRGSYGIDAPIAPALGVKKPMRASDMSDQYDQFAAEPSWRHRVLASPLTYVLAGASAIALDIATGPLLQFPVLFVIPIAVGAWFAGSRTAYTLAIVLPLLRLATSDYVEVIDHNFYLYANAAIRIAVLLFIAYFVTRCSKQHSELQSRNGELVKICAWSRTIEYGGQWISFEEYLERRFHLRASHGLSPAEAERLLDSLREQKSRGTNVDA